MSPTIRKTLAQIPAFLCLLLLSGCGGGNGGGSPTEPRTGIFFTPDRAAGSNSITLRSVGVSSDTLELEVFATDVSDMTSMVVTVVYPSNALQFDGYGGGDFLSLSFPVTISFFDNILITQLGLGSGATGSGTIGTLSFTALADGAGRIEFLDPQALDSANVEITGIDWISGRVEVVF